MTPQSASDTGRIGLVLEQIDQSLGIVGGDIHRVHGTAIDTARIATAEATALTARSTKAILRARGSETPLQTALLQTALITVHCFMTKVTLFDRQTDRPLGTASGPSHQHVGSTAIHLGATALIHQSNSSATGVLRNGIPARFGRAEIGNLAVFDLLLSPSTEAPAEWARSHQQVIAFVLDVNVQESQSRDDHPNALANRVGISRAFISGKHNGDDSACNGGHSTDQQHDTNEANLTFAVSISHRRRLLLGGLLCRGFLCDGISGLGLSGISHCGST